jgi:hypothetical protein
VRAFVRKTRGEQLGRVFFVKVVGDVPLSIWHKKKRLRVGSRFFL